MEFPRKFFDDEVQSGFYVSGIMKRAWASGIEILSRISEICEKHNIRWFAAYGTLLGAVRHHGFIPWDDDMDIMMPRDDFNRFYKIIKEKAPSGLILRDIRDGDLNGTLVSSVGNLQVQVCFDEEFLKEYHDFPYSAVVDIFILDYVSRDETDELWRQQVINGIGLIFNLLKAQSKDCGLDIKSLTIGEMPDNEAFDQIKMRLSDLVELTNQTFDSEISILDQLFLLLEGTFSFVTEDEADEVVDMLNYVNFGDRFKYPKSYFQRAIQLPFGPTKINVSPEYDRILTSIYGDYMTIVRDGGMHGYPYFAENGEAKLEQKFREEGKKNPFHYEYHQADVARVRPDSPKVMIRSRMLEGSDIMASLGSCFEDELAEEGKMALQDMQTLVIEIGNLLEQTRPELHMVIREIEYFCEVLYQGYLQVSQEIFLPDTMKLLQEAWKIVLNEVRTRYLQRNEIVFYLDRFKHWRDIKKLWEDCKEDANNDVYLISMPYHYKNADSTFKSGIYNDVELFPDDSEFTDCLEYNFKKRHPDIIYIQNGFDEYNYVTSVNPTFYTSNIYLHTDKLIYVPPYHPEPFTKANGRSWYQAKHYITIPGVLYADKVIVDSKELRQSYIERLTAWAGDDTRSTWEQKIDGSGVEVEQLSQEEVWAMMPVDWQEMRKKDDGSGMKKTLVFQMNSSTFSEYSDKAVKKLERIIGVFEQSKENIFVLWLEEDGFNSKLALNDLSAVKQIYNSLVRSFEEKNIGVYITKTEESLLSVIADAYYGDAGVFANLCRDNKKMVMIESVEE